MGFCRWKRGIGGTYTEGSEIAWILPVLKKAKSVDVGDTHMPITEHGEADATGRVHNKCSTRHSKSPLGNSISIKVGVEKR